ncbi:uncharacterized protein JCM15063_002083 [Sporobolomyces koalae]|uniref:uncharacterized protein n=1 Tax=Sporobolomyces koalae TaxID=500713 RepID=UPI00317B6841
MDWLADRVDSLAKQASEITLYDVKSAVNKAKAYALNLTEYEQKVREATNDDPWGASSTLMQDIARGTFDFQLFNEIMPTIYSRFTEKEARQWRQIYKALVLIEYLVKNGSERVIDDARSHLSLIKVLRNFHYIDEAGKDQGINVRNRAKELGELLSDLDRVRQERRKAKQNRNKYTGVGNDGLGGGGGPSFTSASGSRYGGFGSDSFNSNQDSSYGPSSSSAGGFSDSTRREQPGDFEEYDAGDDEDHVSHPAPPPPRGSSSTRPSRTTQPNAAKSTSTPSSKPAPPKQPEVNLFDFDDDEPLGGGGAGTTVSPAPPPKPSASLFSTPGSTVQAAASLDDDFDDFQSAVPISAPAQPPSYQPSSQQNVFAMLNNNNNSSQPSQPKPSTVLNPTPTFQAPTTRNPMSSQLPKPSVASSSSSSGGGGADFSDLFSFSSSSSTTTPATSKPGGAKLSMQEIAAQKRQEQLFSSSTPATSFGSAPAATNKNQSIGDGWDSLI